MKMRGGTPGSDICPTSAEELDGGKSKIRGHEKATFHNRTLSLNRHKTSPASAGLDAAEVRHNDRPTNSQPNPMVNTHTTTDRSSDKVQRGNIYFFSRDSQTEVDQKQSSHDPHAKTDTCPEFDADQEHDADIAHGFADVPGQINSNGTDSESIDPPASQTVPADWMEHPISRAMKAFNEVDSPLNPARIIAESLQPFTAPRRPVKIDRAPQVDDPEDAPIRPVSPEQAEQAAELEADAIEARDEFWDLWIGHQDQMRSQCIRLMAGNMADAEDALSSAMLRASKKFPSYSDNIVNGKAWLRKLVYNVCMDHYRQGKYTEYRAFDLDTDIPAAGAMFTGEQQSPEDIALSHEQIRELDVCLDALSGNLRVPLLLRCVEGWSYPDIAKQLNLRADTVRKRIQLARDYLRRSNIR